MSYEDDEEVEDLIQEMEAINPLLAITPQDAAKLTPTQQKFLINFINSGTIREARKRTGLTSGTWKKWQNDEHFMGLFNQVSNPLTFTIGYTTVLLKNAAIEHAKLLSHPSVKIRQWAIELAYSMHKDGNEKAGKQGPITSQNDLKKLMTNENREGPFIESPARTDTGLPNSQEFTEGVFKPVLQNSEPK